MNSGIGIIGGSGLYELLGNKGSKEIRTPYGKPSGGVSIGFIKGKKVFFIPRHGKNHNIPPHSINHKANIYALNSFDVKNIIATASVGIINKKIKPGDFIIPHDFIDFTKKNYTFFKKFEKEPKHTDMTNPFSEKIRKLLIKIFLVYCNKL